MHGRKRKPRVEYFISAPNITRNGVVVVTARVLIYDYMRSAFIARADRKYTSNESASEIVDRCRAMIPDDPRFLLFGLSVPPMLIVIIARCTRLH